MTHSEKVGKRLRELRLAKGLNGEELGAHLGIGKAAISAIELGKTKLKYETWLYTSWYTDSDDGLRHYNILGKDFSTDKHDWLTQRVLTKLKGMEGEKDQIDYELVMKFRGAVKENEGHRLGFTYARCKTVAQIKRFIARVWEREMANRKRYS